MKLTIQISTSDLRKLSEGWGRDLTFNVEETHKSSERLRGMRVAKSNYSNYDPKKAEGEIKKVKKQQKELEETPISDFLIETTKTNIVSYKVIKIEPDDLV